MRREPAPISKRTLAYLVDLGIVGAILYAVFAIWLFLVGGAVLGGALAGVSWDPSNLAANILGVVGISALLSLLVLFLAIVTVFHGYFIYFESKSGETPGKKLFGLRVISTRNPEAGLTRRQATLRDFFRYIDCGLIFPAIISMAVSSERKRLGDLAASTLVVHSRADEIETTYLYVKKPDYEALATRLQPLPVSEEIARQFLHVAYPIFILGKTPKFAEDLSPWEALARSHLQGGESYDQTTLLLFFAQYCFLSRAGLTGQRL
jgi:uncharacterized RDD family membrane protein YckC